MSTYRAWRGGPGAAGLGGRAAAALCAWLIVASDGRAAELSTADLTVFSVREYLVTNSPAVRFDEADGCFELRSDMPGARKDAASVVLRLPGPLALFHSWLDHPSDFTAFDIESSSDGVAWKPALSTIRRGYGDFVEAPLAPIELGQAAGPSFARILGWRATGGPQSFDSTFFVLSPMAERTSVSASGPVGIPARSGPAWVWAKSEDVPGAPPESSDLPFQPPVLRKAEPTETGDLPAGIHTYLVRPYGRRAKSEESASNPEMARPSFWFRCSTGPRGSIRLEWSEGEPKIKIFFDMVQSLDKSRESELADDILKAETKKEDRGFEIWRKSPGDTGFRLMARMADPALRTWWDGGSPVPAGASALEDASPTEINTAGKPSVSFGCLSPGTNYYRVAAVMPDGLTQAGRPVPAVLKTGQGAVKLRIEKTIGANGYMVWRSRDARDWKNTLVAILGETDLFWEDTGLPASYGALLTTEFREADGREGVQAASWKVLPTGKSVRLQEATRWLEYRVTGRTDFPLLLGRTVRVIVGDREPTAAELSSKAFERLACHLEPLAENGTHAWEDGTFFAPAAMAGVDRAGRITANAFYLSSRGGTFLSRDFDLQSHNPIAGRWETLASVRGSSRKCMLLSLDSLVDKPVRAFGPYVSYNGAYAFNPPPAVTPLLLPAEIRDFCINGIRLRDRPLYWNYIDARIGVALGDNEVSLAARGLPFPAGSGPVPVELCFAVAEGEKGEFRDVARQDLSLRPGEEKAVRQRFALTQAGECRLKTRMIWGGKPFYEFSYVLVAGSAVRVERRHPSYRGDLFASDPDRSLRFGVSVSAPQPAEVACRLVDEAAGTSVWAVARVARPGEAMDIQVPSSGLRFGRYRFEADAGSLGRQTSAVRLLPAVPGQVDCYLRDDGVFVREGNPILPIVLWYAPSPHMTEEAQRWLGDCGLNAVGFGAFPSGNLAQRGFLCVQGGPLRRAPDSRDWNERAVVRDVLHASPKGCLAWDIGEELDIWDETHVAQKRGGPIWWDGYVRTYLLFRDIMPFLPVSVLAFDANSFNGPWAPMPRIADVYGLEPYLYPNYDEDAEQRTSRMNQIRTWMWVAAEGARARSRWSRMEYEAPSQKTLGTTLQVWDGRTWNGSGRAPSTTEHRFMAYDALLLGSTFLAYYNLHCDYWHHKFNPLQWEGWRGVIEEVAALSPALTGSNVTGRFKTLLGTVDMGAREYDGHLYVIAANHTAWEGPMAVQCPGGAPAAATEWAVVSEDRTVQAKDGVIRDRIGPFGVHIYTDNTGMKSTRLATILKDPRFGGTPTCSRVGGNLACEKNGATVAANYHIWNFHHEVFAIDGDPETAYITAEWMKDPIVKGPYTLTVTPKSPSEVASIVLRSWRPKHWPDPVEGVRDYLLEVDVGGKWETVANAKGNQEEVVEHRFPPRVARAIRLTIYGGLFVNEIEAYGPS